MKRRTLFSLLMCLILVFSLTLPVYAEEETPPDGSVPEATQQPVTPTEGGGNTPPPTQGGSTEPTHGGSTEPTQGGSTEPTQGGSTEPTQGGSSDPTDGSKPTETEPPDPTKNTEATSPSESTSPTEGTKPTEPEEHVHVYDNNCDPTCNTCGKSREVTHVPGGEWYKNATGHWHVCTICGTRLKTNPHYPGPAATESKDQVCLTCGYVMTKSLNHVHKFQTEYTSDEDGHWYACESCEEQKDFAEHTFDDPCDPDCNVCGYVRSSAHNYGEQLMYDEECHWGVCTLCGAEGDHLNHVPGEAATENSPQVCTVCGMELAPALEHVHEGGDWVHDQQTHHRTCACGQIMDEGPHTWDEGSENSDGTVTYTCTQCGAHKTEGTPKEAGMDPTMLVVGGAALLCSIMAAVVLVILLRRPKGRYS